MRIPLVLFLLLSSMLVVKEAEASWIRNIISKVVNFVKNNCHFNIVGGISFGCNFKFGRKRRSVGSDTGPEAAAIDTVTGFDCSTIPMPDDEIPRRMFDEAFEAIDDNGDEQLDSKEMAQFDATMGIVKNCIEIQKKLYKVE